MNKATDHSPYEIILSIVCFLLIVYALTGNIYFSYAALALGIATLLSARLAEQIVYLWSKMLVVVGKVNGFLLLSAVFFIVLTPLAFFYRVWNKDSLHLKPNNGSFFVDRDHTFVKRDLENPW